MKVARVLLNGFRGEIEGTNLDFDNPTGRQSKGIAAP